MDWLTSLSDAQVCWVLVAGVVFYVWMGFLFNLITERYLGVDTPFRPIGFLFWPMLTLVFTVAGIGSLLGKALDNTHAWLDKRGER